MQEIIATGNTVDEAVENACESLGLTRDDVTFEIIDMPQKKLFGTSPAKVKVTPTDENFSMSGKIAKEKEQQPEIAKTREQKDDPEIDIFPAKEQFVGKEIALNELTPPAEAALEYLQDIARRMGATRLEYKAFETERGVKFTADGEDSAIIIGRRGETMDALQYLCMLISSRTEGDYCKIMLDVANYREKREKTLRSLAAREAAKVKKTLYNQTLEPMNPYERRIVHSAIQEIDGVKSESVGSEPRRRVVISMISGGKGNRNRRPGDDRRGGHGGQKRGYDSRNKKDGRPPYNNNKGSRPNNTAPRDNYTPQPKPENNNDNDGNTNMLYGKIDI